MGRMRMEVGLKTERVRAAAANCGSLSLQTLGQRISGASIDVINEEQKPETEAEQRDIAPQAAERPPARGAPVSEIEIPPTLSGYFQERRASPSAFFKVLRKSKVKRFQANDKEAAGKMMMALDPEGERLWALMSQTSVPEAVDAWIWGASEARLGERFGEAFDPKSYGAARTLKTVLDVLSPGLRSDQKEKEKKKHAETWLRIAICWLMEKRALDAWQSVEELRPVFFPKLKSDASLAKAASVAKKAIQKGKAGELRLSVAMAGLGEQMVRIAEKERNRERNMAADLRRRLGDSRDKIERLASDLEDAGKTITDHEAALAKLERTLADERQHLGHDLTETRAEQKALLGERLGPLLEDAIDALEINPPAPGTALRRVRAALAVIQEAKE